MSVPNPANLHHSWSSQRSWGVHGERCDCCEKLVIASGCLSAERSSELVSCWALLLLILMNCDERWLKFQLCAAYCQALSTISTGTPQEELGGNLVFRSVLDFCERLPFLWLKHFQKRYESDLRFRVSRQGELQRMKSTFHVPGIPPCVSL